MIIKAPYLTSPAAADYVDLAKKVLNQAETIHASLGTPYFNKTYVIDRATFVCKISPEIAHVIVFADSDLFAVHPKSLHPSDYPFDPTQRGVVTQELDYVKPDPADTKTKIEAGNVYWHGKDTTLSWKGSPGFNIATDNTTLIEEIDQEDPQNIAVLTPRYTSFGGAVYESQSIIWGAEDVGGNLVLGACYYASNLIVVARRFGKINIELAPQGFVDDNKEHFILTVYSGETPIHEITVGRFNAIWAFKKDGSAGISFHEGLIYRYTFSLNDSGDVVVIYQEPENPNIDNIIDLNPSRQDKVTQTLIPPTPDPLCRAGLQTILSLPVNVALLDAECKAQWSVLKSQVQTTVEDKHITASGSGEYTIGYGYDNADNEVAIIAEIDLDINHNYVHRTTIEKDQMLVIPVNAESNGAKIYNQNPLGYPDPILVDSIITYGGCDLKPQVTFDGLQTVKTSDTTWKVTQLTCPPAIAHITNCTGASVNQSINWTVSALSIPASGTITPGSTITASGGIPPYYWSGGGTPSGTNNQTLTMPACTSGLPAKYDITVQDSCGNTVTRRYTYSSGHWASIQTSYPQESCSPKPSAAPCTWGTNAFGDPAYRCNTIGSQYCTKDFRGGFVINGICYNIDEYAFAVAINFETWIEYTGGCSYGIFQHSYQTYSWTC